MNNDHLYNQYGICFVIYEGNAKRLRYIYGEAERDGYAILMQGLTPRLGILRSFLCRIQYSTKLNKIIKIPFKSAWYSHFSQKKYIQKTKRPYFIFYDTNRLAQDDLFHTYLRKTYPEAKLIYILSGVYNVSHLKAKNYEQNLKNEFDLIITFDKEDAKQHGWEYCPFPYARVPVEYSNCPESDVLYVGYAKLENYPERFNTILGVYEKLRFVGLRCDFHIVGVDKTNQKYSDEIIYNKPISYQEVLQRVQKTKCILEVVQPDQTGTTLRVQESAIYHKKLLTNNSNIISEPWYDSNNIRVFSHIEDIETDWILSPFTNSDINYEDMFSFKRQLQFIVEKLNDIKLK